MLFLELDDDADGKSVGILMMASAENEERNFVDEEDEDGSEGPGKSCLRGASADMMMLYVMSTAEQVITKAKNNFPQPMGSGEEEAAAAKVIQERGNN